MITAGRTRQVLGAALVCCLAAVAPAMAEDTQGKWQFGFGISYYATTDYIRSNSDIAIATTTAGQQAGLPGVGSVDDRPDENMLNEPSIADDFRFDFNASYGLTRWLALEVAVGYLDTSVGDIEYYIDDRQAAYGSDTPITAPGSSVCGPTQNGRCFTYTTNDAGSTKSNLFVPVGDITEIPVMFSGLFRFRPESPLDPYVGLGFGYIFTNLSFGSEFQRRVDEVSSLQVVVASEGEYTDSSRADKTAPDPGFTPDPLKAEVKDGFEYHAVAGVDYYMSDRFSMYVDARYVWANTEIDITIDGAHQVRFATSGQGKLQRLSQGSVDQPNLWEDRGFTNCPTCANDGLVATEDSNGNGTLDPLLGEGGTLYYFPAGPNPSDPDGFWRDPADAVMIVPCAACGANTILDTEDFNGNGILDRYLLYGVDVCTLPDGSTNPLCGPADLRPTTQFVWPEGCSTNPVVRPNVVSEGCPRPPGFEITNSGVDDAGDIYLIQGGKINLGGFSLGVGMKFTF